MKNLISTLLISLMILLISPLCLPEELYEYAIYFYIITGGLIVLWIYKLKKN